jgi:outer membrane immunogenic protein
MNKLTLSSVLVALLLSSSGAFAADVSAPIAHDWTGFYIGANAGAAWSNSEAESTFKVDGTPSFSGDLDNKIGDNSAQFTGGALAGYNWQHDVLVLGVEADINYADFGGSTRNEHQALLGTYSTSLNWDANWFGTVRGRVGFAADNFLIYGTGGLAYGGVEASGKLNLNDSLRKSGSVDDVQWGWTAGAGAEYAINENWSVGAEYLYVDLGSTSFNYKNAAIGTSINGHADVDYRFSVARATIKYSF